jgi:hypothetical protein
MQIDTNAFGGVTGIVAMVGLIIHIAVYSNKEGKKEQRLAAVEERAKAIPSMEVAMATMAAQVGSLEGKIDGMKTDLKSDIQAINRTILDHFIRREA